MMRKSIIVACLLGVSLQIAASRGVTRPVTCTDGVAPQSDCAEALQAKDKSHNLYTTDFGFYYCMRTFCCEEQAFIEDELDEGEDIDDIMFVKELMCPKVHGVAVTYFG